MAEDRTIWGEGFMTIGELVKEMKKKKARCSQYCPTWNCEDRDCEIYGEGHVPPSRCVHFLHYELERREKMMNIGGASE